MLEFYFVVTVDPHVFLPVESAPFACKAKSRLLCFYPGTRMPRISWEGLMSIRNAVLPALFCLVLNGFAFAQTQITTGVIQGTVLDTTGAVIPGASVVANNVNMQVETTQNT